MRTAIVALMAAVGLGAVSFSAGAAPLTSPLAAAHDPSLILVEGGCGAGWHPVPGHWVGGEWMPTRCAPNDRGGDWSSPYPSYPAYPMYPSYEAYPAPYATYPYPADPYWARPY
jgi:hypothetical protein